MEERTLTSYRERMGRREDEKESEREDRNYHIKGGERRPKERNVQTSKQGDRLSCMRVSAFSGLECWTGVLEWSTGMESLEWSEALEWACDHL